MTIKAVDQVVNDQYAIYQGDSCEVIRAIPGDSIGFGIHSPPFEGRAESLVDSVPAAFAEAGAGLGEEQDLGPGSLECRSAVIHIAADGFRGTLVERDLPHAGGGLGGVLTNDDMALVVIRRHRECDVAHSQQPGLVRPDARCELEPVAR